MANINTNEIERQAKRVRVQTDVFNKKTLDLINNLEEISNIVKSEDSSLSQEIHSLAQTILQVRQRTGLSFKNLADVMDKYVNKSRGIDQTITQEVKSTNTSLNDINSKLQSIPEFYIDFN